MMKKNFKLLLLTPCLFSVLCEPEEDVCGLDEPEAYEVNVENVMETYSQDETIWFNAKTSSMVIDFCTDSNEPELIEDAQVFLDGLFILKLNTNLNEFNADVVTDATITYTIGETFNFNVCSDAISHLPTLTNDNEFYEYRIGISINSPGDYCIVSSMDNSFNLEAENNALIFEDYNTLDNRIRFNSCGDTYTREGIEGHYFFRVQ